MNRVIEKREMSAKCDFRIGMKAFVEKVSVFLVVFALDFASPFTYF